MYYNDLKGKKVSALGFGGLRFAMEKDHPERIDREAAKKLIQMAMEGGINYFDTAFTYQNGDSERCLGELLADYPRDSFFFATKYYAGLNIDIEEAFQIQLERTGLKYFDFYLLHSLDENFASIYTDPQKNHLGFLLKQKKAGLIKNIGFSSHADPDTLSKFLDWYDGFDMAVIQLNYLDWTLLNAKKQYEILTDHNIPVWVMEPLKGGRLSTLNDEASSILKNQSPHRSISSWGMRFLMGLDNVYTVMSGMNSEEQLIDNLKTFSKRDPLSVEEKKTLSAAISAFHKNLGVPCSSCRYCCSSCSAKLNIPVLIKGYNEYNISHELWKVSELRNEKTPDQCIGCGACLKHCPQKIQIPEVMSKFAAIIKENNIDFSKI